MFSENEVKKQQGKVVFLIFPKNSEICGLKNVFIKIFCYCKVDIEYFQSESN